MSKTMPKRITITLPNPVYESLSQLAEIRDEPVAAIATEAVKELVKSAKQSGELPTDDSKEGALDDG
ncbi:MAG: hypothetical protein F6K00_31675 [Leptolyngbya sp. SIOISBB]|nr:hypothetical protein [Leptolyngbya sp. SIOISBB]